MTSLIKSVHITDLHINGQESFKVHRLMGLQNNKFIKNSEPITTYLVHSKSSLSETFSLMSVEMMSRLCTSMVRRASMHMVWWGSRLEDTSPARWPREPTMASSVRTRELRASPLSRHRTMSLLNMIWAWGTKVDMLEGMDLYNCHMYRNLDCNLSFKT